MSITNAGKDLGLLTIRLGEKDNVLTALTDIKMGKYLLNGRVFVTQEKIPRGFKLAITFIKQGARIYKYGNPIGIASGDIKPGSVVHIHNVISTVK
ncbi:UxaA family hydrolase [Chloroflexota bacterium]